MVITADDISFRYSGGPSNADKNESYGNEMSSVRITGANLQNLFDHVEQAARDLGSNDPLNPGVKEYRLFYVKVDPLAEGDGNAGKLWMKHNTSIAALHYRLAVGPKNTFIPRPASSYIPPPGLNFIDAPLTQSTGLGLPAITPGDFIPLAIERTVDVTQEVQVDGGMTLAFFWQSIEELILMEFNTQLAAGMTPATYGNPSALVTPNPYPTPYVDIQTVSAGWTGQGKKLFFSNNVEDGGGLRDTPILVSPSDGDAVTWEVRLWYYDRFTGAWVHAAGGAQEGWTGKKIMFIKKPLFIPAWIEVVSVSSGSLEMRVNDVLCTVR